MRTPHGWISLLVALTALTLLGCDPENTARYPCVESDCQSTCQTKGRPIGDDSDHPYGRCVDDSCQCLDADTSPQQWTDPEQPATESASFATDSESES